MTFGQQELFCDSTAVLCFGFERCCKNWKMKGDEKVNFKSAEKERDSSGDPAKYLGIYGCIPKPRAWPSDSSWQ